ncbi:MAG: hypothetical protein BTN85_1784 [Candidatus Methanohalarchaeum thermophilum]|uniref:Uncharacterized protein n=1 Tax=Methanohalarchaeum thermophilum TaxID=1903181 RepID=A0A1Q6DS17_METT1|nr:MAG: hypothetical protein BTN85_1784 [Candidatus Methanohalarchaeum thermophilum]
MVGFGLLAEVINSWLPHFFWAVAHIGRGLSLLGGGQFTAPSRYGEFLNAPFNSINIFIGTRILIWAIIITGLALIVWGIIEEKNSK